MENGGETGFEVWLKKVCASFLDLTDPQRNKALDSLIRLCGPDQLRFLSTRLEILIKRDFLRCLPLELSFHVLKWLDPVSLCRCCLVSKDWNKVICGCSDVWREACGRLGMNTDDSPVDTQRTWKDVYIDAQNRMEKLRREDGLEMEYFHGHTARVFALCYRDNFLASGKTVQWKIVHSWLSCCSVQINFHELKGVY